MLFDGNGEFVYLDDIIGKDLELTIRKRREPSNELLECFRQIEGLKIEIRSLNKSLKKLKHELRVV